MDLITLDFETLYDQEYSLRKLTTEQYIRDPRFEVIGFAIKINDGETEWFSGDKERTARRLWDFDWSDAALLAQNTMFDAGILSFVFGIHPKRMIDTMSMGRAALGVDVSVSLENLAKHYGVGAKGTEVLNAIGKRRTDFTPEELARYGEYCINDVELTYEVYHRMIQDGFPLAEMKLIDMTLRMFTEPRLVLDTELLKQHLQEVRTAKRQHLVNTLEAIGKPDLAALAMMDGESSEPIQKALRSNDQFAQLLESLGVPAPTKVSATTGKTTWAFAKTDDGFRALQDHPDPRVQSVVAARLGVKTTLEETRTERFIEMSARGKFPIPLKYAGARTYRWSGCLVADTVVTVYNIQNGVESKRIVDVLADDLVWDGTEFVAHDGVAFSGYQEVIEHDGIAGTPDHVVYTEQVGPCELHRASAQRYNIQTARSPDQDAVDAAIRFIRRGS